MPPRAQDLIDELLSPPSDRPLSVQNMEERSRESRMEAPISDSGHEAVCDNSHEEVTVRVEPMAADESGVGFLYVKRK